MAAHQPMIVEKNKGNNKRSRAAQLLQTLLSLLIAAGVFTLLRWSIDFMRDEEAPERLLMALYAQLGLGKAAATLAQTGLDPLVAKLMITAVALLVGVLGVWALFWVFNDLVRRLPFSLRQRIRPIAFVGPAILLLSTYLIYPALNTVYTSLTEDILSLPEEVPEAVTGSVDMAADLMAGADNVTFDHYLFNGDTVEVARVTVTGRGGEGDPVWLLIWGRQIRAFGWHNYAFAFTDPAMRIAFRNNVIWLLVGTSGSVALGLFIASLVDRVKREALAKSFIFLPLAISFVGASVIWRFVYAWQPAGRPQIGLLNAIATALGSEPIPWTITPPVNTYALIVIMVWLQTGFAMVVLSAALKGVPNEVIEAARIDGANEVQLFFRVIIPMIRGSIITVATTIFIAILRVFDIVYVMTSGKFETEVIANRMFVEMFNFRNFGRASALAVILLVVVLPIIVVNIRNLREQGINQ